MEIEIHLWSNWISKDAFFQTWKTSKMPLLFENKINNIVVTEIY